MDLSEKSGDIMRSVDKLDKIGAEKVKAILMGEECGLSEMQADEILKFIAISGTNAEVIAALEGYAGRNETFDLGLSELKAVTANLAAFGVPEENFAVDLTIARGLDYYTGTVYETTLLDHPEIGSVCSGGRYDNLAGYYIEKQLPGVGISIGLTRLFYVLDEQNLLNPALPSAPADALVLPMTPEPGPAIALAQALRAEGIKVQLYGDATIKNLVLKTNGGEKISGLAYVSAEYGKDPAISMAGGGVNLIKLDCGDGVKVSESSDNPTDFWFVVPPTTFSEGITVTATDVNGKTFTKSTNSRFAIGRNALQPMAALYVKCDAAPVAVMEIKYTATEKLSVPSLEDKIVLHTFDEATGEGVIGLNSIITLFDEFWFKQNKALTSIVIPNGVTTIDDTAFSWCTELSEITIPSSVTEIGYGAFNYTGKIKRVNITDIDAWCRISFGNNYYATPFYNGAHLYVNGEELTVLNVPEGITRIDDYAFCGCESFTEVVIPNSVEYVGYYAFYDCDNLKKVTLGEKVNYVGQSAFSGDTSLSVIHCRALTPPETPLTILSDGSFFEPYSYYDNYGSVHKIIVPLALLDAYKIAYKDNYASVVFPDVEPELTGDNVIYY